MNQSEAQALVARLIAAYPRERVDRANVSLFTERLMRLKDPEVAYAAIDALIDSHDRLPTIAMLREGYFEEAKHRHLSIPRLDEPELTADERAENLRRVRELVERYGPKNVEAQA